MTETVERLKAVRFQVDSMICQSDEAHCVYPDPNPVVNELDEIIALLATPPRITEEAVGVVARYMPCRGDDGVICEDDCLCKAIVRDVIAALPLMGGDRG